MSRKISEHFKVRPKISEIRSSRGNLNESLESCEKIFDEVTEMTKIDKNLANLPKVHECRAILRDVKHQMAFSQNYPKKFEEKKLFNEENKCKFCAKKFTSKSCLSKHVKKMHSNEIELFDCKICNKNFLRRKTLEDHEMKKHFGGESEKNFECDFCGKFYKNKSIIQNHMEAHLPSVKCEICEKVVKVFSMPSHQINSHSTDRKFKCNVCSKSFKSARYLKIHEKTHKRKFKCELCNKMFALPYQLGDHKRNHENPKSFECEICGKKFNKMGNFKMHQKILYRKRLKPFKCNRCDYATDYKHYLVVHQNSHGRRDKKFATMKNPVKCEKCPNFFKNKQLLWSHMSCVHPKVLFQCDLCAKFIKVKPTLVKHIRCHIKKNVKVEL